VYPQQRALSHGIKRKKAHHAKNEALKSFPITKMRVLNRNYVIKGNSSVDFMFSSLRGRKYLGPRCLQELDLRLFTHKKTAPSFAEKFYCVLDWSIFKGLL
jgi:hypothetical protein